MRPPLPDVGGKRLLMTNDAISHFMLFDYPMTPAALRDEVRALAGTDIGIFQWCIGTPLTARHASTAIETRGAQGGEYESYVYWHLTKNFLHLIETGHDPLRLVCEEGHGCGMQVWGSQRMNDRHHMYGLPDTWALVSPFIKEHPECVLADGGMNWLRAELQDRVFEHLREVAENYDVDGLDLDYTRIPPFFAAENAAAGREAMTAFVRRTREMLDAAGAKKGKRLGLSAQCYAQDPIVSSLTENWNDGLDLRRWAKEGLLDILIAHYRSKSAFEPDVSEWLEAVRGTPCQLYAGPGKPARRHCAATGALRFYTLEEHRAIAANLHRQGVDGISFYDYMHHGSFDMRPFREMGKPEALRFANKVYVAQVDLPLEIGCSATGGEGATRLQFSDDVPAAIAAGHHPRARFVLNVRDLPQPEDLRVFLNGREIGSPGREAIPTTRFRAVEYDEDLPWFHLELSVDPTLLRVGWNDVRFALSPRHQDLRAPCRVMKVDLEIRYTDDRPCFGAFDRDRGEHI